jgi:hypothetical protein
LPGTLELVWGKRVDKPLLNGDKLPLSLRVYTGINPSGDSRGVGEDAMRVNLFARKTDAQGQPIIIKLAGSKRVHRVAGWKANLQNRIDRWAEGMKLCPKCGMPMVERKGTNGKFLGCLGYPACHNTENL